MHCYCLTMLKLVRPDTEEYQYVSRMKLKRPSRVQNKDDARKVKLLMRICREIRMCNGHELTSLDLSATLGMKNSTEQRRRMWNGYELTSLDLSITFRQKGCTKHERRMWNVYGLISLDLSVTLRQKNCKEHRRRLWNGYGLISLDISVTLGQKDCTEQG